MRIPEVMRRCVCFVGYRKADGTIVTAGTGFFVCKKLNERKSMVYCLTARHVLEGIAGKGIDRVLVRLNLKNGTSAWVEYAIGRCRFHPTDEKVDVAIIPGGFPPSLGVDHICWPMDRSLDDDLIERLGIGPGDDVFLTGMFFYHTGKAKALPVVRVGNIAAMPEEAVLTRRGPMDAYLIESRSIGGLSGSPVFVHTVDRSTEGRAPIFLLGLMHGHFDVLDLNEDAIDDDSQEGGSGEVLQRQKDKVNAGIAIVVPVQRIMEVLNDPALLKEEAGEIARDEAEHVPTQDATKQG